MRELLISEVELVNGGVFSPMEVALGVGFIGLTVSYLSFTAKAAFASTASAATAYPLTMGGVTLGLYCLGSVMGAGAAVAIGGMLITGYVSLSNSDQPYVDTGAHSCG